MTFAPCHKAKAQVATTQGDCHLTQAADGTFHLAVDSTTDNGAPTANNSAPTANNGAETLQHGIALYSPYAPKTRVYNSQKPLFKTILKEQVETKEEGKEKEENKEKWFFLIPDSVIGRQLLIYSRLSQVPVGFQYPIHMETTKGVYAFYVSPDKKKLLMKETPTAIYADTLYSISKAVDLSSSKPIVKVFNIEEHKDGAYRIDATSLLLEDKLLTVHSTIKNTYRFTNLDANRSRIVSVHSYDSNIEIHTARTYATSAQTISTQDDCATLDLSSTIMLLPQTPMTGRLSDPRVGFKKFMVTEFSDYQQRVERKTYTTRWRLEPKSADDALLQSSGTAIEPKRPITYHIDPAFPAKWHPYIKAGVAQWQKAFEQAGWKNAIQALDWPTSDSIASMEDSRFNVIRYIPTTATTIGAKDFVYDPRTGEILNAPITLSAGTLQELRNNYVGDCGAVDTDCHTAIFPDELMGSLISHQIARAVGTTLGLEPNLLASSLTPTDSLRSKTYIEHYGIAPSITDNLPYNFVAQPGDGLTRNELIPRVGEADEWSIFWGYSPVDKTDEQAIAFHLRDLTTTHLANNPRHQWSNGNGYNDPRCQSNDLGDDQVKATNYGIENLKRIAPYLVEWGSTNRDLNQGSANAYGYWSQINKKLQRHYMTLANNITGRCASPLPATTDGTVYSYPDGTYVQQCISAIINTFGQQPAWTQSDPTQRFSWATPERAGLSYASYLSTMPTVSTLHNLNPAIDPMAFVMQFYEYCFKEAVPGKAPNLYNRTLQSTLLNTMTEAFEAKNDSYATGDERAVLRYALMQMQTRLKTALPSAPDATTRNHYALLLEKLEDFFTVRPKQTASASSLGSIVIMMGATE